MTKQSAPINVQNVTPFNPALLIKEMDLQFFATSANKIKFGLKNVHYSVITDTGTAVTYGTPVPIRGSVSISISPNGELSEFHADDIVYWSAEINNGYDGDLEIADIPESFATDVIGDTVKNGVQYESSEQRGKKFALTFEINGDEHARRYVLYYCTATRPTIASNTKSSTVEPVTSSLTFQARPHPYLYVIKANTTKDVAENVFNAWNTTIHVPTTTETP
jgi:phi13 family phage major tail protein